MHAQMIHKCGGKVRNSWMEKLPAVNIMCIFVLVFKFIPQYKLLTFQKLTLTPKAVGSLFSAYFMFSTINSMSPLEP